MAPFTLNLHKRVNQSPTPRSSLGLTLLSSLYGNSNTSSQFLSLAQGFPHTLALPFNHEQTPNSSALAGSPVPTTTPSPAGGPSASRLHNRMASELRAPEKIGEGEKEGNVCSHHPPHYPTHNCPFKYLPKPLAVSVLGGVKEGERGSWRRGKQPPLNCVQPQLCAGARCRRQPPEPPLPPPVVLATLGLIG